jgi:hypothetical protein
MTLEGRWYQGFCENNVKNLLLKGVTMRGGGVMKYKYVTSFMNDPLTKKIVDTTMLGKKTSTKPNEAGEEQSLYKSVRRFILESTFFFEVVQNCKKYCLNIHFENNYFI